MLDNFGASHHRATFNDNWAHHHRPKHHDPWLQLALCLRHGSPDNALHFSSRKHYRRTTADCGPIASTAVPSCAQACFTSAAPKILCDVHDYACQCQPAAQKSLTQLLVPCVATACPAASLQAVIAGASSGPSGSQPTGGSTAEPPPTTARPGTSGSASNCQPVPVQTCDSVASSAVPKCAQACFTSAAPGVGCDVHDYGCQCKPDAQASLTQLLVPCVATACPAASLQAVITGASSVCACASASPTFVAPGTCATGHSSGGGSGGSGSSGGPSNTGSNGSPTTTGGGGASPTCSSKALDCGAIASTAVPSLCACATGPTGSGCGGSGGSGSSTGGNGSQPTGRPTGGNGGGESGSEPTGGEGGSGGNGGGNGGGSQPTGPLTVPPSAGSRLEMSLVAGIFAVGWAMAVVL
ncbi:cell wall manno [Trichoderma cornu-damae]|uniref:Cell wall manno n=1 Tax=Trichoderma cornu-damae TaxID=654480 RepID=A0A9P8TVU7_9HYPO|nr:cell wall manno [Trichoderma cornu-damae]